MLYRYGVEGEAGHLAGILAVRENDMIGVIKQILDTWRKE